MIDYGSGKSGILYHKRNRRYGIRETGRSAAECAGARTKILQYPKCLRGTVDLGRGSYTLDGKSILGICTMDLTVPLTLSIYDETENVLEKIREFLV